MQDPEPTQSPRREAHGELARPPDSGRQRDFSGAEHLVADSASELLERLLDHDPFELGSRLGQRLIDQAILIDPERLIEMVYARVAHDAMDYEGRPGLDEFFDACIDRAVASFLVREAEEDANRIPPAEPDDPFYQLFAELLGIEPELTRTVSLHYHHLPLVTRRAFQAVLVEQKSIHRWVAEGHGPPDLVMARLEYAVEMLSTLGQTNMRDPDQPRPGGGRR